MLPINDFLGALLVCWTNPVAAVTVKRGDPNIDLEETDTFMVDLDYGGGFDTVGRRYVVGFNLNF